MYSSRTEAGWIVVGFGFDMVWRKVDASGGEPLYIVGQFADRGDILWKTREDFIDLRQVESRF
jgi:hypothetical protein